MPRPCGNECGGQGGWGSRYQVMESRWGMRSFARLVVEMQAGSTQRQIVVSGTRSVGSLEGAQGQE